MYKFKYSCGVFVKDISSDLKGYVEAQIVRFNESLQLLVQPLGDDKNRPEGWIIDEVQLKLDGKPLEGIPEVTEVSFKFSIGDKVKDSVSGFVGTITTCVRYINGCNKYEVTAKSKKSHKKPEQLNFFEESLVLMSEKAITPEISKKKPKGGPSMRASSIQ